MRPPDMRRIDMRRYIACCDIGGTKVLAGLVDQQGQVLVSERYLLGDQRLPIQVIEQLRERYRKMADQSGVAWSQIAGTGCSITGPLDLERENVISALNVGPWENYPLKTMLETACGCPAFLEVDSLAAALGEGWVGAGIGAHSLVYLVIGTGIGAGIVLEGKPLRGWRGLAGEIGHTTIAPDGPPCSCGNYGCFEALASGPAIALRAKSAIVRGNETILRRVQAERELTAADVIQAARQGDGLSLRIIQQASQYIGIGLANIITFLDPEIVVLGGGVLLGGWDIMEAEVRKMLASRLPAWVDLTKTLLLPAVLAENAALIGVARLAWDELN